MNLIHGNPSPNKCAILFSNPFNYNLNCQNEKPQNYFSHHYPMDNIYVWSNRIMVNIENETMEHIHSVFISLRSMCRCCSTIRMSLWLEKYSADTKIIINPCISINFITKIRLNKKIVNFPFRISTR